MMHKIIYMLLKMFAGEAFANPLFDPKSLLKAFFWQKILRINTHVKWPVHWSSQIKSPEKIKRGNRNPGMSMGCYIDGRNGIEIGENTWIGPKVSIISMNHDVCDYNTYVKTEPIKIGNNCWIGAGAIILPAVTIADHVIVAAGSVVNKSITQSNVIVAGVPAAIVKEIPPYKNTTKTAT